MRVLIIDDSPADRELTVRRVAAEFPTAEFMEVGRKPDFVDALDRGGFDAALTDYRLHWADGLWVLKQIQARYPYTPVIFLTESGSEEIAVEGMKAGLSDYVLKQHPARLPLAVRESIEKTRPRQDYDRALAQLQHAHAELKDAAEQLDRRVADRTSELAQANAELQRQDEELRREIEARRRIDMERERLLAENREQRELLEHLLDAAPVGIAVVRRGDLACEFLNTAYVAATRPPAQVVPGQPFALAAPCGPDLTTELLRPVFETGQPIGLREFECVAQDDTDEPRYWDLDAIPLHDAAGDVERVLLLVSDVTQKVLARMQVEDLALQLAEERRFLDSIMDNLPAAVTYLNTDLVYRHCNPAAARDIGLPVDRIIGRPLQEVVPGNPHLWQAMADVVTTGRACPETKISVRWQNRAREQERYYLTAFLPDFDSQGQVRGLFAQSQDITATVEAQRKLEDMAAELEAARDELEQRVRERTAELEAIFASLPDAVYVGDENGIQRCNQIALDNLGCQSIQDLRHKIPALSAKLQNRYADTGERIWPEDEAFARALRGQPWTYEVVSRNITTGQDIVQRCAAQPILRNGQVIGAVAVNTDITERKRMEVELRRQSEQLRALSHHLVHLQEAERLNLSRELHDRAAQSMTALVLQLGALQRKAGPDDALRARLQTLLDMAQGVMADLHDLAVNLRPPELDRYGLVAAIERYLETFRKQNRLDVHLVAPELTETLLPDELQTTVYRIVQESLVNVARHAEASRVGITLRVEGAELLLTIQDDGRGFDVDEALRRGRLGLLGMRERAEMLNGRLVINSAPGSGTEVHLTLPLATLA